MVVFRKFNYISEVSTGAVSAVLHVLYVGKSVIVYVLSITIFLNHTHMFITGKRYHVKPVGKELVT